MPPRTAAKNGWGCYTNRDNNSLRIFFFINHIMYIVSSLLSDVIMWDTDLISWSLQCLQFVGMPTCGSHPDPSTFPGTEVSNARMWRLRARYRKLLVSPQSVRLPARQQTQEQTPRRTGLWTSQVSYPITSRDEDMYKFGGYVHRLPTLLFVYPL
jgi:hypothetical protein